MFAILAGKIRPTELLSKNNGNRERIVADQPWVHDQLQLYQLHIFSLGCFICVFLYMYTFMYIFVFSFCLSLIILCKDLC